MNPDSRPSLLPFYSYCNNYYSNQSNYCLHPQYPQYRPHYPYNHHGYYNNYYNHHNHYYQPYNYQSYHTPDNYEQSLSIKSSVSPKNNPDVSPQPENELIFINERPIPDHTENDQHITVTSKSNSDEFIYDLRVIQSPVRARMCGFTNKDRRSITPLPFLRLMISDKNGPVNINDIDPGFFIARAVIFNKSDQEATVVAQSNGTVLSDNLVGEKVTQGVKLHDTEGKEGIWFIFRDLSVRVEGEYYIEFSLIDIGRGGMINTTNIPSKIVTSVHTETFPVHKAKKFSGMTESTPLSHCFKQQGYRTSGRRISSTRELRNREEKND